MPEDTVTSTPLPEEDGESTATEGIPEEDESDKDAGDDAGSDA